MIKKQIYVGIVKQLSQLEYNNSKPFLLAQ